MKHAAETKELGYFLDSARPEMEEKKNPDEGNWIRSPRAFYGRPSSTSRVGGA